MVSLGFVNCFRKYQREPDPVQRRRLKWAIYGLTLGVLPMSLLMLSEAVLHSDLNTYPMLILAPGILSPLIVPFALAYAVLVYRVFDVGVFVREGLLATWSAVVLTVLVMAVFSWQTYVFVSRRDIADWQRALGVAGSLCGVLVVNRCGQWLRGWVDRRFFQEARRCRARAYEFDRRGPAHYRPANSAAHRKRAHRLRASRFARRCPRACHGRNGDCLLFWVRSLR